MRECYADPMHADGPVEVRRRGLEVGEERNAALQALELAAFDLVEARVAERADEGVLREPVVQRHRGEVADAPAQVPLAALALVPCYEQRAGAD